MDFAISEFPFLGFRMKNITIGTVFRRNTDVKD